MFPSPLYKAIISLITQYNNNNILNGECNKSKTIDLNHLSNRCKDAK